MQRRRIGTTDIEVTPVAMGCWPISGMTSLDVNDDDSLATLNEAVDAGINFFDTAFCYGASGESERLIAKALRHRRDEIVIASKGGIHWHNGRQAFDASPAALRRECEESLRRLKTDHVYLLYLHAPDPETPVETSAETLQKLFDEGKTRSIGASNLDVEQLNRFQSVARLDAVQPFYNMLQREIEADLIPWSVEHDVSVIVYWPLLKGLLAGKLPRDHVFDDRDGRKKYPMFQGEEWEKNQDFLDELRPIASDSGITLSQLAVRWTIDQTGVTAALCGAKRPRQIRETAASIDVSLTDEQRTRIQAAIDRRGVPASKPPV